MINQGERDENLVKLRLIEMRDTGGFVKINGKVTQVQSVGFNGVEYGSLPKGTDISYIEREANKGNMLPLEKICAICGISKAGARDKADVFINGLGYSVKSHQAAPPAIVNHTPRNGWLRIANEKALDISILDKIIKDYWAKRKQGIIKEDTCIGDRHCPFNGYKEELRGFLEYYLFEGSGSARSKVPAYGVLEFTRPLDESTWEFSKGEYLDKVWNRLVFSIRNKGMNDNYPHCKANNEIAPWVEHFQGSYKGSLHVRVR